MVAMFRLRPRFLCLAATFRRVFWSVVRRIDWVAGAAGGCDGPEDVLDGLGHHGCQAQDEALQVWREGIERGLEIFLALRPWICCRVVHGIAEASEQPGHGNLVEVGKNLLFHAAFGATVEDFQFEVVL